VTTLAFIHAHPDDEALLTAGTMARAADEGHRVILITATDGGAGLTGKDFAADLATTRLHELRASADLLHVSALHTLGYADSGLDAQETQGFSSQPIDIIAEQIRDIARSEHVDVLIGYDSAGGYGHPDHLHVHAATRHARNLLGRSQRLFEVTLPREPITKAVKIASRSHLTPRNFDASEFARSWTPRAQITHRVNVRGYLKEKRASLRAHSSQAASDDSTRTLAVLASLPTPIFSALLGTEYYVRVP
jgi:LmbE family N-acetylglucosaminyl deacetylase